VGNRNSWQILCVFVLASWGGLGGCSDDNSGSDDWWGDAGGAGGAGGTHTGGTSGTGGTAADECQTDEDCPAQRPHCSFKECVECVNHTDCEGLTVLCEEGACLTQSCDLTEEEIIAKCGDSGRYCLILSGYDCAEQTCIFGMRDCDDGDRCTQDSCSDTEESCVHTFHPPDGNESGTLECDNGIDDDCDGLTDMQEVSCGGCSLDAECDDGNPCTVDSCVGNACANEPEATLVACDDGDDCTQNDHCYEGACTGAPLDEDGDGHGAVQCGGDDCDDEDPERHPGKVETPGPLCNDGIDNDCSGQMDDWDGGCHPVCLREWCWRMPHLYEWNNSAATQAPDGSIWFATSQGAVVRWDGTTWTALDSGTTKALTGIWASPAGNIWVIAAEGFVATWDGVTWTTLDPPPIETTVSGTRVGDLLSVGGLDDNNVWVGSWYGDVGMWDGVEWTGQAHDDVSMNGPTTTGLAVASNGTVYAASSEGLFMNTGGTWALADPTGTGRIALIDDDDIWVTGADSMLHYDGNVWTSVTGGPVEPHAVWAAGTDDVWVVHGSGPLSHFDGLAWTEVAVVAGNRSAFWALAGTSDGDVWYGGDNGRLVNWDGTASQVLAAGHIALVDERAFHTVFMLDPQTGWAAGEYGVVFAYDGARWSAMPENVNDDNYSGDEDNNYGLWADSPTDLFLVGHSQKASFLERWDGTAWTELATIPSVRFRSVWGTAPDSVWVTATTGTGGTVYFWNGTQLQESWTGAPSNISDVDGSSATDVWVVGSELAHYDGSGWSAVALPCGPVSLKALAVTGPDDVWVGGSVSSGSSCGDVDGIVARYHAGVWTLPPPSVQVNAVKDIWASASDDVWVLDAENVLRYDGATWSTTERAGAMANSISATPTGSIWGVGGHRTILERAR
jgi:hypothetical protein